MLNTSSANCLVGCMLDWNMVGSLKILDYDLKENVMSVQVSFKGILLNILLIKNNFMFLAISRGRLPVVGSRHLSSHLRSLSLRQDGNISGGQFSVSAQSNI